MITRTHNGYHLGDNLVHLHFMRKVALANPDREFIHAAQWQYIRQLSDLTSDVPNLNLMEYGYLTPSDSINAWRGDKQFWYSHPDRNDFVKFHVEAWFPFLADRMGVENPIKRPEAMLFDYPAIQINEADSSSFDVLMINSIPGSGQWTGFSDWEFSNLAIRLHDKGLKVIPTQPVGGGQKIISTSQRGLSVTDIGHLSLHCHAILMISTGPSWPTFNIWNQESIKNRIILLDNERVNLSPNTTHCRTIDEASEVLKGIGLL
jgi:hypothetical protein